MKIIVQNSKYYDVRPWQTDLMSCMENTLERELEDKTLLNGIFGNSHNRNDSHSTYNAATVAVQCGNLNENMKFNFVQVSNK